MTRWATATSEAGTATSPAGLGARLPLGELFASCLAAGRSADLATGTAHIASAIGRGVLPYGAGGHAVVAAHVAEEADLVWVAGRVGVRDRAAEVPATLDLLHGTALVALRGPASFPGTASPAAAAHDVAAAICWLRLGTSRWLLNHTVAHLRERRSGGRRLTDFQLVQGDLADSAIDQTEVGEVLAASPPDVLTSADLDRVQVLLTRSDLRLLWLLGAHGFTLSGPGRVQAVSELLGDVYQVALPSVPEGDHHAP